MSEEELLTQLEQVENSGDAENMFNTFLSIQPVIVIVIMTMIILYFGIQFLSKRAKDKAINEELGKYYDEYMEGDYDMDFQDFCFCRQNGIKIRKRKYKSTNNKIAESDPKTDAAEEEPEENTETEEGNDV